MMQKPDKIQGINSIECPVLKLFKSPEVFGLVVEDKIMWNIIHQSHQLIAFIDDGDTLSPCQHGGEQTRNFDVLFFTEPVWNRDRIIFDKPGMVVLLNLGLKKVT